MWPCLNRRFGPGDFQRSLPTSALMWFCDLMNAILPYSSPPMTTKMTLTSSFSRHVPWTMDLSIHRSSEQKSTSQSLGVCTILCIRLNNWKAIHYLHWNIVSSFLSSHMIWHYFQSNLIISVELNRNIIFHIVIIFKILVICLFPVLYFSYL